MRQELLGKHPEQALQATETTEIHRKSFYSATLGGFGEVRRISFFLFGYPAEVNTPSSYCIRPCNIAPNQPPFSFSTGAK